MIDRKQNIKLKAAMIITFLCAGQYIVHYQNSENKFDCFTSDIFIQPRKFWQFIYIYDKIY